MGFCNNAFSREVKTTLVQDYNWQADTQNISIPSGGDLAALRNTKGS